MRVYVTWQYDVNNILFSYSANRRTTTLSLAPCVLCQYPWLPQSSRAQNGRGSRIDEPARIQQCEHSPVVCPRLPTHTLIGGHHHTHFILYVKSYNFTYSSYIHKSKYLWPVGSARPCRSWLILLEMTSCHWQSCPICLLLNRTIRSFTYGLKISGDDNPGFTSHSKLYWPESLDGPFHIIYWLRFQYWYAKYRSPHILLSLFGLENIIRDETKRLV